MRLIPANRRPIRALELTVTHTAALRVLLICPDKALREDILRVFNELGPALVVAEAFDRYLPGRELSRAVRTFSPQILFVSYEDPDTAVAVAHYLESETAGMPVVGVHAAGGDRVVREAMRSGARDFLVPPFYLPEMEEVLDNLRGLLHRAPLSYTATDHIYSFLPSKPGVGTSTVAINASAALAREPGMSVLLSDLDLTCGIMRFLLKLPRDLSVVDALPRTAELDLAMWPQLVTKREGFDILHSGSVNPQAYLDPPQVQGLIDFARSSYRALMFDMSGNLERHSVQVMQESKQVFLVCNPEPASLYMGREKIEFLKTVGVGDRVVAIINRSTQALALPAAKAQEFLGVPVAATFLDDRFEVGRAESEARSLSGNDKSRRSKLALEFKAFARKLARSAREDGALPLTNLRALAEPA
jgi:pilus assembly protein CpaE